MRRTVLAAVAAGLLAVAGQPALGHATISQAAVEPGATVALTVQSIVEREALINDEMRIVVPRQWKAISCTAPATWSCTLDRTTVKPHVLAVFTPVLLATPADIDFTVTVQAPSNASGTYLFRALQTHADGWVEPWVYDKEPYPAPRVQVGAATRVINSEGSRDDPRCFGPTRQPADYDSHDGRASDCAGTARPAVRPHQRAQAPTLLVR